MRCDVIAQGIVAAAEQLSLRVPIVVRLQGEKPLLCARSSAPYYSQNTLPGLFCLSLFFFQFLLLQLCLLLCLLEQMRNESLRKFSEKLQDIGNILKNKGRTSSFLNIKKLRVVENH